MSNSEILSAFLERPSERFISDCNGSWNRGDFLRCAVGFNKSFYDQGLGAGDRIGILATNSKEYAAVLLACLLANFTAVPLNCRLSAKQLRAQSMQTNCRLVLAQGSDLDIFPNSADLSALRSLPSEIPGDVSIDDSNEALVMFTSGSYGMAKGVLHTVGSLFAAAIASNKATGFREPHSWLVSLPFYHMAGYQILLRAIVSGGTLRVAEDVSAAAIATHLKEHSTDYISLVPTQLHDLKELCGMDFLEQQLGVVLLGGAAAEQNLLDTFEQSTVKILSCYGMTETATHVTCLRANDPPNVSATVGRPIDGVTISTDENGQILIDTPQLAKAYLLHDGTVEELSRPFRTNDLGSIDAEGFLHIHGRRDDVIVSGGENISLREIERTIQNCPSVKACAVVPGQHPRWGTRPHLFVEYASNNTDMETNLRTYIAKNLPRFQQPDSITAVARLPRTSIGKISYEKLKDLIR